MHLTTQDEINAVSISHISEEEKLRIKPDSQPHTCLDPGPCPTRVQSQSTEQRQFSS